MTYSVNIFKKAHTEFDLGTFDLDATSDESAKKEAREFVFEESKTGDYELTVYREDGDQIDAIDTFFSKNRPGI